MLTTPLIIDLILLAILLVFAILGAKRGLIQSLFSLVSVLVAFVGAILISNFCAAPVAEWLEPTISPSIESAVESAFPDHMTNAQLTMDNIIQLIEDAKLPFGLNKVLSDYITEHPPVLDTDAVTNSVTAFLAEKITLGIAYIALFLISFILILLLWKLLSRTLNFVSKLPGLNFVNRVGGFLFGILRVSIVFFVLAWLARLLLHNAIPQTLIDQSYLFRFYMTVNPLDYLSNLQFTSFIRN